IVGDQLRAEVAAPQPHDPVEGEPEPTMTPEERLARWEALAAHMDDWWPHVPRWREEVRATFLRWEAQDPAFVALWREARERRRPGHLGRRRAAVALLPAGVQDPRAVGLRAGAKRLPPRLRHGRPAGRDHLLAQGERPRLRRRARRRPGAGAGDHRGEEPGSP